jgi:hypothetical protein
MHHPREPWRPQRDEHLGVPSAIIEVSTHPPSPTHTHTSNPIPTIPRGRTTSPRGRNRRPFARSHGSDLPWLEAAVEKHVEQLLGVKVVSARVEVAAALPAPGGRRLLRILVAAAVVRGAFVGVRQHRERARHHCARGCERKWAQGSAASATSPGLSPHRLALCASFDSHVRRCGHAAQEDGWVERGHKLGAQKRMRQTDRRTDGRAPETACDTSWAQAGTSWA